MIPIQTLLNSLQAWAQEELAGQRRMLAVIVRQEASICANDPDALAEATRTLEPELAAQAERVEKRRRLFVVLAAHLGADPEALTLGSILERCGPQPGLEALRGDLRRSTVELLRRNRHFAALAGAHRRLVEELVSALLQAANPSSDPRGGALVNAQA